MARNFSDDEDYYSSYKDSDDGDRKRNKYSTRELRRGERMKKIGETWGSLEKEKDQ